MKTSNLNQLFSKIIGREPNFQDENDRFLGSDILYLLNNLRLITLYRNDETFNFNKQIMEEYFVIEVLKNDNKSKKINYSIKNPELIDAFSKILTKTSKENNLPQETIFKTMSLIKNLRHIYKDNQSMQEKIENLFDLKGSNLYQVACDVFNELEAKNRQIEYNKKPVNILPIDTVIGCAFYKILKATGSTTRTIDMFKILDYAQRVEKNFEKMQTKIHIPIDNDKITSFFRTNAEYFSYNDSTYQVSVKDEITENDLERRFLWTLNENVLENMLDKKSTKVLLPEETKEKN